MTSDAAQLTDELQVYVAYATPKDEFIHPMRVAPGTTSVAVRLTRRGGGSRRRSTATYRRAVRRAGVITLTIRTRAVRRLRTGRYTVRVTPFGANGAGPSTVASLVITR